jgi:hypothetical protein
MSPAWDAVLSRIALILERLVQVWLAFKSGQWKEQKRIAETTAEIKDEQNKIAVERPRDRDDLVRRLRERGL